MIKTIKEKLSQLNLFDDSKSNEEVKRDQIISTRIYLILLITILFIQVGLGILLTFFRCGVLVYIFSTKNQSKSPYRINIELLLDKISLFIYYMNFAKSFYVNISTSTLFRQVFRQRIIYLSIYFN